MSRIKEKISDFVMSKKEREFDTGITFQQLTQKKVVVMSWGATEFEGHGYDALVFKVNGMIHKGYVVITLGYMDTYNVSLLSVYGNQVGETTRDVYCDRLTDTIDLMVETETEID